MLKLFTNYFFPESHQNPISSASYLSPTYSYTSYNAFRRPDYSIYRGQPQFNAFNGGSTGIPLYRASKSAAAIVPSSSASIVPPVYHEGSAGLRGPQIVHYGSPSFGQQYHYQQPITTANKGHWNSASAFGSSPESSELKPKLIKFSAKDGKSLTSGGGIGPRESLSETTRKVIQYEVHPDALLQHQTHQNMQLHHQQQYRSPRRIKMGSFIKPRSVGSMTAEGQDGKSDGLYIQV